MTPKVGLRMNLKKLISDYLQEAKLMSIATVKKNKPWVATVWYIHDENFNLYFVSRKTRRHSLELKENPNVSGAIAKPHKTLGVKTRGLQFEGICQEVRGAELIQVFSRFIKRFPGVTKFVLSPKEIVKTPHRFYKIVPSRIVLFDEINFPDNPRQELKL